MSKKEVLFKSDERRDLKNLAEFLHGLADKIAAGEITLKQGDSEVSLNLPNIVELELEVEQKVGKNKTKKSIELEIEWKEGESPSSEVQIE